MTEGILLIDKPSGITSFSVIYKVRKFSSIKKIGHTGTLDPLATGVLVLLVGRTYTKLSDSIMASTKEYITTVTLGSSTTTYDSEGEIVNTSDYKPTLSEIEAAITMFQGTTLQTPPMFSAKKVKGQKLYDLARKGIEIERQKVSVSMEIEIIEYAYPHLVIQVVCSKGTYIRSLAHDIGNELSTYGHITQLKRTKNGAYTLDMCHSLDDILSSGKSIDNFLLKEIL